MEYLVYKALHIIFVVTWFSGLFYSFRLMVYYAEANDLESEPRRILQAQYRLMLSRLWKIISWPSAILTLILGTLLLINTPALLDDDYMHVKLLFVALLYGFQFYGQRLVGQIGRDELTISPMRLRLINEVPTVILVAVVFLIVLKNSVGWIWGVASILGLAALLTVATKWYKRIRDKS